MSKVTNNNNGIETMNDEETVYYIKYALTTGITKVVGHTTEGGRFISVSDGYYTCMSKKQWIRSPREAVDLAKSMRDKKLLSLRKSIAKLEKMEFTVPE